MCFGSECGRTDRRSLRRSTSSGTAHIGTTRQPCVGGRRSRPRSAQVATRARDSRQPTSSAEPMEYFRSDPAWDTVFHAVSLRLAELGRVGGTITLADARATQALERVGCPVKGGRVNLARLDAELRAGRYPDGLWATVERYFGREIAVNAE